MIKIKQIHIWLVVYVIFTVGDINQSVLSEKDYDITILGAVGNVLGN